MESIFKKYPKEEPPYNGIHYLTIINVSGNLSYDFTYFNNDAEFEPKFGEVVAFCIESPRFLYNLI